MCSLRTYLNSYSAVRRDAGTTYTVHNSRAGISFLFGGLVVNLFSLSLYVFLLLEFLIQLTGQLYFQDLREITYNQIFTIIEVK